MSKTFTATDASFEQDVINAETPVVVDFWAEWCGPCKMLSPILDEMAEEFEGKVKIVKVDIDANPETPTKLGVRGIPTLVFFNGGEAKDVKVGAHPKGDLTEWVNSQL